MPNIYVVSLWQVNQKMILTLTASIMYWSLQQTGENFEPSEEDSVSQTAPSDGDGSAVAESISDLAIDDAASDTSQSENGNSTIGGWPGDPVHWMNYQVKEENMHMEVSLENILYICAAI